MQKTRKTTAKMAVEHMHVKRDLRKAEEEEKWREKANNTDQWKQIKKVAVFRSDP